MPDIKLLRKQIRCQRNALDHNQQRVASALLWEHIHAAKFISEHNKFAFYYSNDGEIETKHLINKSLSINKHCYLPVLYKDGSNRLNFAPVNIDQRFINNHYGISEPRHENSDLISGDQLDVVFMPLVAYDEFGNRVGMGKGYYDHTFAFLAGTKRPAKPKLIGLAHSFQQVSQLTVCSWDIPLDGVITEKGLTLFTHA